MIPETSTKLLRNVRHNDLGKAFTLDVPAGYGSQRLEATSWNINRVRSHSYSPVRAQENSPGGAKRNPGFIVPTDLFSLSLAPAGERAGVRGLAVTLRDGNENIRCSAGGGLPTGDQKFVFYSPCFLLDPLAGRRTEHASHILNLTPNGMAHRLLSS